MRNIDFCVNLWPVAINSNQIPAKFGMRFPVEIVAQPKGEPERENDRRQGIS